jgi:hypothetical protein
MKFFFSEFLFFCFAIWLAPCFSCGMANGAFTHYDGSRGIGWPLRTRWDIVASPIRIPFVLGFKLERWLEEPVEF